MMTTAPNAHVAKVHDRLVVTLRPGQFGGWLDGSAGREALLPAGDDALRYWPVSKGINSVRADKDDKTLIEPIELSAPATLL
jgi:putative SOS response-associated peptidase YedK